MPERTSLAMDESPVRSPCWTMSCGLCALLGSLALGMPAPARAADLTVDGSVIPPTPETGWLKMGTSASVNGQSITANNRYLEKDGKPWLPVMGEFHYSRFPADEWDTE